MIKVIIERTIAEGPEANFQEAIRDTLKAVIEAPGYISSKSLTDVNRPNHRLIITDWTSEGAWDRWYHSDERKAALAQINVILDGGEKITVTHAS